jgi:hypothetical protein
MRAAAVHFNSCPERALRKRSSFQVHETFECDIDGDITEKDL